MKLLRSPLLLIFLGCSLAWGQAWSGILVVSRAIDWTLAGAGTIPARATICSTLTSTATAAEINSAIAACTSGQTVFLSAGTYSLSTGLLFANKSNITLRGAGPANTKLVFTAGDACFGIQGSICVRNATGYTYNGSPQVEPGGSHAAYVNPVGASPPWTAAQGVATLTFDNVSTLSVGSIVIFDQDNDATDTTGLLMCDNLVSHPTFPCTASAVGSTIARTISGIHRGQTQIVEVTAITGSDVTFTPGLYALNWRSSQNMGAWWTGAQVTGVGIEDLTIDSDATISATQRAAVSFVNARTSWVKNIRSYQTNLAHVWVFQSSRITVRDSYFYGTKTGPVDGSNAYGVNAGIASDNLTENNIFQGIASPMIPDAGGSGNVYGYNYTFDNIYQTPSVWMQVSDVSHAAGNHFHLFEGNHVNGVMVDSVLGNSGVHTMFRNRIEGTETGRTENRVAIVIQALDRGVNVIGNILGTAAVHNNYQATVSIGSANCQTSIYNLGWGAAGCQSTGGAADDSVVISTLLRWGNYDTFNAAVRWEASEVPTAGVTYIGDNPVPANQVLPSSFYLTQLPTFWSRHSGVIPPWPAIGPDVVGGTGPGGFSYDIPAKLCFDSLVADPAYPANTIRLFDAKSCYPPKTGCCA